MLTSVAISATQYTDIVILKLIFIYILLKSLVHFQTFSHGVLTYRLFSQYQTKTSMVTAQLLLVFPEMAESLICTVMTAAALCPLLSNTVELDRLDLRIILTNRAYINFRLERTCHWEDDSHGANQSNKGSRYVTSTQVTQMSSEKVSPCLNDYWEKSTFTAHELGQNQPLCLSRFPDNNHICVLMWFDGQAPQEGECSELFFVFPTSNICLLDVENK